MAGGRYAGALFRVMEQTREIVRAANEQADIARSFGDTEHDARRVRAQALYEGMSKIREASEK